MESWIVRTGQAWKLYVTLGGLGGALLCWTVALFVLGSGGGRFVAWTVSGIALGLATFAWFAAVLRCPHCRAKLVWTMVASRPHSSWVVDLAALERCPACNRTLAGPVGPT